MYPASRESGVVHPKAMMRCAHPVPIKLVRAAMPVFGCQAYRMPIDCFVILLWTSQTWVIED